jgi:glutathionylspermidine synthase
MTGRCTAGPALEADAYRDLCLRAIFECHKWDLRRGDARALCRYPLVVDRATWRELAATAEALAAEALAAEAELVSRPELHARLGLPRWLRRLLGRAAGAPTATGARIMRFDFHPCVEGFRVSEGNIDAAGGLVEASGLSARFAERLHGLEAPGDPAGALAEALRRHLGERAVVGLAHFTMFTDDRQIMTYLADRLAEAGLGAVLFDPAHLRWRDGRAEVALRERMPLDAVYRFVPAEWLDRFPWVARAGRLANGGKTPVTNPVAAVLTQSKRFPALLDRLRCRTPTWRSVVPETRAPEDDVAWEDDPSWVLKPALAHEGDRIGIRGVTPDAEYRILARSVRRDPAGWAVQRRFAGVPIDTPDGERYPSVGVYVVDGRAAGAYGRVATRPLIDARAQDAVVLVGA